MTTEEAAGTWTADDWAALWALCGVLVTAIAATFALVQLRLYIRESLDRARPFVICDFVFVESVLQFQLWNSSPTAAAKVKLSIDRPLRSSDHTWQNGGLDALLAGHEIPHFPPGRMIGWGFDYSPSCFEMPDLRPYHVTVSYEDPRLMRRSRWWRLWEPRRPVRYEEPFELDIRHWTEASIQPDGASKVTRALEKIDKTLKKG